MVSVCLPSDALLQHLPSYSCFSYLGRGVSLHGCSSKAQPLLLTLDEGYLLTASLPDLQRGIAPLGPPAPVQPRLLGRGVGPPGYRPWPPAWGCSAERRYPTSEVRGGDDRSYPISEVRGGDERSYPTSEVRGGGTEEILHAPKPEAKGGGREDERLYDPILLKEDTFFQEFNQIIDESF